MEKTGDFYINVQLPNIERHFNGLIDRIGNENNLSHLKLFLNEMKKQFEETVNYEKRSLFPSIREGRLIGISPRDYILGSEELEEKLHDLLTFFLVHLKGKYDRNLCMAVVISIFSLNKDLKQNNRIRSRILVPLLEGL